MFTRETREDGHTLIRILEAEYHIDVAHRAEAGARDYKIDAESGKSVQRLDGVRETENSRPDHSPSP